MEPWNEQYHVMFVHPMDNCVIPALISTADNRSARAQNTRAPVGASLLTRCDTNFNIGHPTHAHIGYTRRCTRRAKHNFAPAYRASFPAFTNKIVPTKLARAWAATTMDRQFAAGHRAPEDTVSLTSLENDADDFDRLMIQSARDQRQGNVQAFRKARTHPRVGVTLENLERHNAKSSAGKQGLESNMRVAFDSPPSSSGSTMSDPALRPPSSWGRKARVKRSWMRDITADQNQQSNDRHDTPQWSPPNNEQTPKRFDDDDDADAPRQSIEDSPLSHKSSLMGTPVYSRRRSIEDWDFDMNEASLIASTPYFPRSTALEDIRQREMESLREPIVSANRPIGNTQASREETQPSRQASNTVEEDITQQKASSKSSLSGMRVDKPDAPYRATDAAQADSGQNMENSPIVVYKKVSEEVGIGNSRLFANGQGRSSRPSRRREDSHDLLRRLARASNTPSPGRTEAPASQAVPTNHTDTSSKDVATSRSPSSIDRLTKKLSPKQSTTTKQSQTSSSHEPEHQISTGFSRNDPRLGADATPMPASRSLLKPKTPVVTGAWVDTIIDTPGPSIAQRPTENRPSVSSRKTGSTQKTSQESEVVPQKEEQLKMLEILKPTLPRSALAAIVEEARSIEQEQRAEYGDSTINSLEEMIAPFSDTSRPGEPDEDTLLGIQMPTHEPRTEAERQRQQEARQLHAMNERLRAARTSLRDTNRGIRRVEDQIEHSGDGTYDKTQKTVVHRECPCASDGEHQLSFWKIFKTMFYSARPKSKSGRGLTMLSVALLSFLTWFILENIAWLVICQFCCIYIKLTLDSEIWGHHEYASSYKGYGVVWGAPEYPYVLPTMTYRAFIKPWWHPIYAFLVWTWKTFGSSTGGAVTTTSATATRVAQRVLSEQTGLTFEEDAATVLGMAADEVVR